MIHFTPEEEELIKKRAEAITDLHVYMADLYLHFMVGDISHKEFDRRWQVLYLNAKMTRARLDEAEEIKRRLVGG
jgi:hypothetical protein